MIQNKNAEVKKFGCLMLAVLLAAAVYAWDLWYCGGLYRAGTLLSASAVSEKNFSRMLCRHLITVIPELAILICTALLRRKDLIQIFGFRMEKRCGHIAVCLAGMGYFLLLAAGFAWGKAAPFAVLYQWFYYLVFIALAEELVFRGLLPWLVQRSGLPEWCVWVIPGVLFGCMHTLIPVIEQGVTVNLIRILASSLMGYLVFACGAYALRRWSGTLWLSVLLHAALDFTVIFA